MNYKLNLFPILRNLKFSPKHLGYIYLQSCVIYAYENKIYLKSLSKYVYPAIAKQFNSTPKSIEKAISNAIQKAFVRGGLNLGEDEACPTNKEVISYIVNQLTEQSYKSNVLNVANFYN